MMTPAVNMSEYDPMTVPLPSDFPNNLRGDPDAELAWRNTQRAEQMRALYMPELPAKAVLGRWTPPEPDKEAERQAPATAEWGEPILFDRQGEPDPITADALPGYLGEYADALAKMTQTPPAFAVASILAVLAVAAQGKYEVAPRQDGYTEPVNLWTCNLALPGTRKSPIVRATTSPFRYWERDKIASMQEAVAANRNARDMLKKRIDELKKQAAKPMTTIDERNGYLAEMDELEAEMPEELVVPRLWADDITVERLQTLLVDHGGKMAIITDEGGAFATLTGLYSNGNFNVNALLQSHSGDTVRVDRQTRTVILDRPALTMGLSVQPSILTDMTPIVRQKLRGNGMLARFLYFFPKTNLGYRDVYRTAPIPPEIEATYRAKIGALLDMPMQVDDEGKPCATMLTLTAEALSVWLQFSEYVEIELRPDGDLREVSDWAGKLPGAALRIAGLLHIAMHGAADSEIDAKTMQEAVDLCGKLISHALAVFGMIGGNDGAADARQIHKWIVETKTREFTRHDAWLRFRGWADANERLETALRELENRMIISAPTKIATGQRGRPSFAYQVNPSIFEKVKK